jgi:uncharacterized protein (DUF2126 family)
MWKEQRLPSNVDPFESQLENAGERTRLMGIFERGLDRPAGYVFPVSRDPAGARWQTGPWFLRQERCYLVPGDSSIGFRLPLDSLPWAVPGDLTHVYPPDPTQAFPPLAPYAEIRQQLRESATSATLAIRPAFATFAEGRAGAVASADDLTAAQIAAAEIADTRGEPDPAGSSGDLGSGTAHPTGSGGLGHPTAGPTGSGGVGRGTADPTDADAAATARLTDAAATRRGVVDPTRTPQLRESAGWITRTAMCAEARNGVLYIFMPPAPRLEDYLELVAAIEATASSMSQPVVMEGYEPPRDPRLNSLRVTPDPGVVEVNIHPSASWDELVKRTTHLYEQARQSRLTSEKFMLDGRHTGTGGGNHFVLGG